MSAAWVEVWRGSVVESMHRVSAAVVDAAGRLRARAGDPGLIAFARSAAKPLQAVPLLDDGAAAQFEMTDQELALCCASHNGEELHVQAVQALLRRIGVDQSALACGAHAPMHEPAARMLRAAGREPERVHNNCSGKHAGMLALARVHGWPVAGYEQLAHPVQQRMLREIAAWTDSPADEIQTAVDGCGVVTFALPVTGLAAAYARLGAAVRRGEVAARVIRSMARWPEYVGGTDRLCTRLIRATGGRIVAKVGAEGVYCAAIPGAELGVALKVEDGAARAAEPALLKVLQTLGVLSDDELADLSMFAEPFLTNTRGDRVGLVRAVIRLEPAA